MGILFSTTITADGDTDINLKNIRTNRNIYTVFVAGDFGGAGALTALLSGDDTNFVAIKDSGGSPVLISSPDIFNFEVQADPLKQVMRLRINLTGATSPSINLRVYDGS